MNRRSGFRLRRAVRRARWMTLCAVAVLLGPIGARVASADTAAEACPPPLQLPTPQQAAAMYAEHGRDRGVLYRLSRNGHTSYLYGTIHVGKIEWMFPGPGLLTALTSTDTLAVELNLADPAVVTATRDGLAALPPKSVASELQARLDAAVANACLDAAVVAQLRSLPPLAQLMSLSALAAVRDGIRGELSQEGGLLGMAQQFGKQIVGLETVETQLSVFAGLTPTQVPVLIAETLDQLESGAARRTLGRLADSWLRGDLVEIGDYRSWCQCEIDAETDAFMKRVNDDRNVGIAATVEQLHGSGKRILVAVGVLHLTGEKALPKLLEGHGFTVERIAHAPPAAAANAPHSGS